MPRYKRRSRHYHKKKHSQDQNGSDSHYNNRGGALTAADRALLLKYLLEYKSGCERVCFPHDVCQSDEETVVTAPAARNDEEMSNFDHDVEIGGSRFPALTNQVLCCPYLELPKNLTSKHRRAIHELCVDGKEQQSNMCIPVLVHETTFLLHSCMHAILVISRLVSLWCWRIS